MKVKPISVGDRVQTELSRVQLTVRYVTVIGGSIDIDNKIKKQTDDTGQDNWGHLSQYTSQCDFGQTKEHDEHFFLPLPSTNVIN